MNLVRLGRVRVQRHVGVHLRDGRLERAQRVPGEADVQVLHGSRRQRLALRDEEGVGRVGFDRVCVRVRLPH